MNTQIAETVELKAEKKSFWPWPKKTKEARYIDAVKQDLNDLKASRIKLLHSRYEVETALAANAERIRQLETIHLPAMQRAADTITP